ncbi:MAG: hypothetical protein LC797_08680, partial [Chloroflexi bacterium]|nr:hypothetical protein [Chloroflexota bacterium]
RRLCCLLVTLSVTSRLAHLAEVLLRAGQVAQAAGIAQEVLARAHHAEVDGPLRFGLILSLSIQVAQQS